MYLGLRTYLVSVLQGKKPPQQKFVLFGQSRSGKTLLASALNSHPDIHCDGEILRERILFPILNITGRAAMCEKKGYGFELLLSQITSAQKIRDPKGFFHHLDQKGYRIIYIQRRNLFLGQLSSLYAQSTRTYNYKKCEAPVQRERLCLEPMVLIAWMKQAELLTAQEASYLEGIPFIHLEYEKHLEKDEDLKSAVHQILDTLGLPKAIVSTGLEKDFISHIHETIENYAEIVDAIKQTAFASYLDW